MEKNIWNCTFFFFLISGIVHFFYMLTDDRVSKISFDSIFFCHSFYIVTKPTMTGFYCNNSSNPHFLDYINMDNLLEIFLFWIYVLHLLSGTNINRLHYFMMISLVVYDFRWVKQWTLYCITDSADGDAGLQLAADQPEIIFMGTGTSEGIPRVSCLTNPLKTCLVWPQNCCD